MPQDWMKEREVLEFTREEKLKAIAREISLRRNVYPGKVESGRMKQAEADYQLAIMIAIAKDYGGHG